MKGKIAVTFYEQIYSKGDEVACCPYCDTILLTSDNGEYEALYMCPECWDQVDYNHAKWVESEKDGEHNPPETAYNYSAHYIIHQGSGDWERVKYRTEISGTVDEIDKLQTLLRKTDMKASTLIKLLETSSLNKEVR